jgi:GGDEF domain-containing protein
MRDQPINDATAVILTATAQAEQWIATWCAQQALTVACLALPDDVLAISLRSRPRLIVLDARGDSAWTERLLEICASIKRDSFTAVIPLLMLTTSELFSEAFAAGADEVVRDTDSEREGAVRVAAMLRRSDRDVDVHPSTRLPGTREIETELERRIASREMFAVCYADLDHFKEFNDRYSYYRGNQVIQLLARLLHDVVKGLCGREGFVGHIGGDDFLYVIPIAAVPRVSEEVIRVFDELMPLQYSENDQRVGYFFGKDRRGQLHRVPLMTLSIGVVTNQRRRFRAASEVSELATEMKTYAKTLPGSVWVVDRRRDEAMQPKAADTRVGNRARAVTSAQTGGAR